MIQGMKRRGRKDWTVYILRCGDGSLYTGIAKDVQGRIRQHSEGRGATYTRTRLPVKLLYQQEGLTRSEALVREAQIKAMPRSKKEEIIFSEHWNLGVGLEISDLWFGFIHKKVGPLLIKQIKQGGRMGEIVHTSRIKIVREKGPTRRAMIEGFDEPIYYGVHGGIKRFYKIEPEKEHAATLDHIVAATAAWMMGTLARFLAERQIPTPEDSYRAEVEGDIENVNNVLKITQIRVKYYLKVPSGKSREVKEAFSSYLTSCPAAQSVIGCIQIKDDLIIEEAAG
jgi:predicted GIY-YIG superfamily endonuclease